MSDGTIHFLNTFTEFWRIVNVHDPYADVRNRDPNRAAINSPSHPSLNKLIELGDLAKAMAPVSTKQRVRCLTRDTSTNLWHTYNGLVELSKHLLSVNHDYVLLGKFSTDPLEKQFGKLRQGSGGTYFITVQQIIEKVSIHKAKLLLRLNVDVDQFNVEPGHSCSKCGFLMNDNMCTVFDKLPELENSIPIDAKMALVYVAGYVVRKSDNEIDDTYLYYEKYGSFTQDLDRGGLKTASDSVCQWVFYGYILFREIADLVCRKSLCNILMMVSDSYQFNMERSNGLSFSNILLKNHCLLYSPRSGKEPKQKVLKLSSEK